MAKWIDTRIDGMLKRLGYTKAADRASLQAFFAGETPPGATLGQDLTAVQRERLMVTSAWVWSDIANIANVAVTSEFNVYQTDGESKTALVNHEYEQRMRVPNEWMGGSFLLKYSFWWELLRGEAYWMLVEDSTGELTEIWPLPSERVQPVPSATDYISGFLYHPLHGRAPIPLAREQVFFWRLYPNPFDYHRGMSPMTAYYAPTLTDLKAAQWYDETFDNDVTLKTLFGVNAVAGNYEAVREDIIEQLEVKRKQYMVAPAEDISVTTFSMSPTDVGLFTSRAFSRDEIDRVFGYPGGYWSKDSNRANADSAEAKFIGGAVWPPLVSLAEDITAQILVPRYGADIVGQFQDIRPRDRRLQVAERKAYWPVTKLNEARGELGQEEYDGPLAELISELPVSLATNPQFVMALAGLGGVAETVAVQATGEAKADLRRWRSIELRRLREGHAPGSYDFESDWLPVEDIKAALAEATTEDAVKAAFEVEVDRDPVSEAAKMDPALLDMAIKAGVPVEFLWSKLGMGFTEADIEAMKAAAYGEGEITFDPERMERVENDSS